MITSSKIVQRKITFIENVVKLGKEENYDCDCDDVDHYDWFNQILLTGSTTTSQSSSTTVL